MKLVIVGILSALSLAAVSFGQTAPDLNDQVCVMYQLNTTEEAQYSATSATLSQFWSTWDTKNAAGLQRDYVFMASDNPLYAYNRTAGITFSGHDDAQMTVRIAYGVNGAYFYLAIEDVGAWTPYTAWQTDCSDIYVDITSLAALDPSTYFNPTQWALTTTSLQCQIPFGGATPPQMNFRRYDPSSITVNDLLVDNNDATNYAGMSWKLVSIDATHKTVEWFLPWSVWGLTGAPAANARLMFAPGYNDVDDGVEGDVKSLRWIGLCDPYCGVVTNYWGEIEAGPALSSDAVIKKLVPSKLLPQVSSTERYTLRGDKISGSASRVAGLFVTREILSNGNKTPYAVGLGR